MHYDANVKTAKITLHHLEVAFAAYSLELVGTMLVNINRSLRYISQFVHKSVLHTNIGGNMRKLMQ